MKTHSTTFRRVCTHIACIGAGCAIGFAIRQATVSGKDSSAHGNSPPQASTRASDRSRGRPENFKSGTEILRYVAPHVFAQNETSHDRRWTSYSSFLSGRAKSLIEAADKLAPADDIRAAALRALEAKNERMKNPSAEMTPEMQQLIDEADARILHWIRKDPLAALQAFSTGNDYRGGPMNRMPVLYAAIQEQGADAAIGWLKDSRPPLSNDFQSALALLISSEGNRAQLEDLRKATTPAQWNQLRMQIGTSWPLDKSDELLEFAISNQSPEILLDMVRYRRGNEGTDWLMKTLADENLDPAFRDSLTATQAYRQFLIGNPQLPLDTRLDAMAVNQPEKDREQLALELGGQDVASALDKASKDWRFSFRNGRVTFEEVYEAVSAELPELAASSPDAIRLQILKELAEENGTAALEALAHTPEPDKWTMALKPTQWMFHGVNPQEFYDYLQNIPHDDPVHHQARFESWVWHSQGNLNLYSRDYVDWVKALPEGPDREMAAIGILRAIGKSHPALREEVDALVVDPSLRDRIEYNPSKPQ